MKSVIVAWCNQDENTFENQVPLRFIGEHNQKLGFKCKLDVVFFSGFKKLSKNYINSLKNLGYELHDLEPLFLEFDKSHAQLNRFGAYEKRCFLRWPILRNYFGEESLIHYDGDIIFNEDPEKIAQKLAGKTFFLQGCPAFTVISSSAWFDQYTEELNLFMHDIEKYSQNAWIDRMGWEYSFRYRWAGSRFRKIITSDQDFLSHLVHSKKIVQDSPEEISLSLQEYVVFQNPLFIHLYDENWPHEYSRENGIDYFSYIRQDGANCFYKKRVLFWHMQSTFNFYLCKYMLRRMFCGPLKLGRINLDIYAQGFEDKLNKKINRFIKHISRLKVCNYFFEKHDFSGVLNETTWWKPGVFAKLHPNKVKIFEKDILP